MTILVSMLILFNSPVNSTNKLPHDNTNPLSFVIIGAFVFQKNAKVFTAYARKKKLDAHYALNPDRSLYYVYSFYSPEKEKAIEEVYRVREKYKITDAWVYSGALNGFPSNNSPAVPVERKLNVPTYDLGENQTIKTNNSPRQEPITATNEEVKTREVVVKNEPENVEEEIVEEPAPEVVEPDIEESFKVYVNAVNLKNFTEVTGPIELVDEVRQKIIKKTSSHQLFGLNDPGNGKAAVKCVSRIFGYKPKEVSFSLTDPVSSGNDSIYIYGDSLIIDFGLERLARGDVMVMWSVLFYKDAAIMRPESRAELLSLLDMMTENNETRIKLHGHTNGNSKGRVIYLGDNDKDFFTLNGQNHKEKLGSAKDLSQERAFTIQHWLMENGIDESRIEIQGWGGKKMLQEKHSAKAYENVRVEVEVL